jgi:ABC-2 type transport system permease protein
MIPAAPAKAMWLIARLRLTRMLNMFTRIRFGRAKPGKSRVATPAKRRIGWLIAAVFGTMMLFVATNLARESLLHMQCYLEPESMCMGWNAKHELQLHFSLAEEELHMAPFGDAVALALTMQLSLLFLVSFLIPLSNREIANADWDLEWLVTLPANRSTLLWGRILERTLANPTGWIMLAPCSAVLAWYSGFGWASPLVAIGATLALLPLAALLRTLCDTGLRMSLAPSQLRNVQAVTAIIGLPMMYLSFGFGAMHEGSPVLSLARQFPAWPQWLPPGVLIKAINATSASQAAGMLALLALEITVPIWAGMQLLRHQLRNGVVASGARESARSTPLAAAAPRTAAGRALAWLMPQSPIKRRELHLLARDRNFLIQSVLLPLIIVGGQLIFTASPDALAEMAASPKFMAGMAFGIGSYMLMLSAFQTLNNEGQALWMLYTVPHSLEKVLKEKAEFWGSLALLYPLLILGASLALAPALASTTLRMFAVVLLGIPIFSTIAVALGVFGCDPQAQDARAKVRPGFLYLYMTLSGLYIYGISAPAISQTLVLIVLLASLALALWQKARDQLPYLLDPSASPPARVSTADGLIAATLFFVLQGAIVLALVKVGDMQLGEGLVIGFGCAGLAVYAIMRLVYWLTKTTGVPVLLPSRALPALGWGLGLGMGAGVLAIGYLLLMVRWDLFPEARLAAQHTQLAVPLLLLLTVVAAPLCEEFIFRGLIFGGLRRSMALGPAMLMSAALFAIVHPPASMLPVFVLGLGTAWVYERTRSLLGPMLLHAMYNAIMVAYQLL